MEVICTQFVYKKCTHIYSIVPNVYLMYTQKIHTGNVIDFDVFFLYTAVRGCVYKKSTTDTNWKYVINFDVQVSQYNQKKHTKNIQHSRNALTQLDTETQLVYSALWVQVTLFICYLPFGITQALTDLKSVRFSSSVYLAKTFSFTFVFLNSALNPLLYCWKIKEVRQAVKDAIRQICSLTQLITEHLNYVYVAINFFSFGMVWPDR